MKTFRVIIQLIEDELRTYTLTTDVCVKDDFVSYVNWPHMNDMNTNKLTGYTFMWYMTCLLYLNFFYKEDTFCVKKFRNIYFVIPCMRFGFLYNSIDSEL